MLLLRAVNQYAYTNNLTALFSYQSQDLADGFAGGKNIINNENPLTWAYVKTPLESSPISPFLFSKYASHSKLSGYFIGQNNATSSRPDDYLNLLLGKVGTN